MRSANYIARYNKCVLSYIENQNYVNKMKIDCVRSTSKPLTNDEQLYKNARRRLKYWQSQLQMVIYDINTKETETKLCASTQLCKNSNFAAISTQLIPSTNQYKPEIGLALSQNEDVIVGNISSSKTGDRKVKQEQEKEKEKVKQQKKLKMEQFEQIRKQYINKRIKEINKQDKSLAHNIKVNQNEIVGKGIYQYMNFEIGLMMEQGAKHTIKQEIEYSTKEDIEKYIEESIETYIEDMKEEHEEKKEETIVITHEQFTNKNKNENEERSLLDWWTNCFGINYKEISTGYLGYKDEIRYPLGKINVEYFLPEKYVKINPTITYKKWVENMEKMEKLAREVTCEERWGKKIEGKVEERVEEKVKEKVKEKVSGAKEKIKEKVVKVQEKVKEKVKEKIKEKVVKVQEKVEEKAKEKTEEKVKEKVSGAKERVKDKVVNIQETIHENIFHEKIEKNIDTVNAATVSLYSNNRIRQSPISNCSQQYKSYWSSKEKYKINLWQTNNILVNC